MDFSDFDWADSNDWFRRTISQEMNDMMYERLFKVNDGDIVVDAGASVGPFIRSILAKDFAKCYAVEPMTGYHAAIRNNTDERVTIVPGAFSDEEEVSINWLDSIETVKGFTLPRFVEEYGIERIDFLKTDCEGGEYTIFKEENLEWLKANCKYCVGEWHLSYPEVNDKFRKVRDTIFPKLKRVVVFSVNGFDITSMLHTEEFMNYYKEVIIHIEI